MNGTVLVHDEVVEGGAAIRLVTLCQPSKKNALTPSMLQQLIAALPTAPSSSSQPVRVVVLQGAGATFSSGFDLSAFDDVETDGPGPVDPITAAADALEHCPVPIVCAVDGACFGGAVELCCACTLRVASTTTTFGIPAVRLGLVYPASGLRRLRRRLGPNVERMLLPGLPFSALQGQSFGLVHDVVDDARTSALSLAHTVAANAPLAVSGTLEALAVIDAGGGDDLIETIRARALRSSDLLEGLRAQKEKRPPKFGGR